MSYLILTNKIRNNELTNEELVECLEINNVTILKYTILKLIERQIKSDHVKDKLLIYSHYFDMRYKILGMCKLGHLSIYALKKLGYDDEFQNEYSKLDEYEKNQIKLLNESL